MALWASLITSVTSVVLLLQLNAPWAAATTAVPFVTAGVSLAAMWVNPSSYPRVMHLVAAGTLVTAMVVIVMFGGIFASAGAAGWGTLMVVGTVAIFADRRAHFWLIAFGVGTAAAALLAARSDPLYEVPNPELLAAFNLVVISLFIYAILYYFVRKSDELFHEADGLLRNVLPDDIAERLKSSEEMIADEFESASILFADISGFTPMAARMEPGGVVALLNEIFTVFDDLVEERGLEKIKTIGDAYMVASGVPAPRPDHARAICDLALAMQSQLTVRGFAGRDIRMRIGVASGPVTAGIIGRKKFSYDLWGDTVNLASRMETTGVPGRIQIPAATRELVHGWFDLERRGIVEVSGRGDVETWFLVGASADRAAGGPEH